MRINLKLTSKSASFDACGAAFQAQAFVLALADILHCRKRLATHELAPNFSPGCVTVWGELDLARPFHECVR